MNKDIKKIEKLLTEFEFVTKHKGILYGSNFIEKLPKYSHKPSCRGMVYWTIDITTGKICQKWYYTINSSRNGCNII